MTATNAELSDMFDEIADLLEIEGANTFRVRAYRNAARVFESLPRSAAEMVRAGEDLSQLPGIGEDLAAKVVERVESGGLAFLDALRERVSPGLVDLLRLPGLGPKRVKVLHEALGVKDVASLTRALESGKVEALRGFGEKSVTRLREALAKRSPERRFLIAHVEENAQALVDHLKRVKGVQKVEVAGSFRRRRETVGDLDVLIAASEGARAMDAFTSFEDVERVLQKGDTKAMVVLASGLQVDARVVPAASFGAALHYFTGSKAHNIAVRKRGLLRGLKVNEYGVFRGDERVAGRTERSVYRAVGLPFIPPELREDTGEIEAARDRKLPRLVTRDDLRGDLQTHTTESDGRDTLEAMARAAQERGLEYLAVTDHTPRVAMAEGPGARRLAELSKRVAALNDELDDLTVLLSAEVEIHKDGKLDLPDKALDALDIVVCAAHYHLDLPREEQTRRILTAMANPRTHVLAHPTGRLLGEREGATLDMARLLDAARDEGWFVEINAQPTRLDLDAPTARLAKEHHVLVAIDTDAHSTQQLDLMRFGIDQARRAWLEKDDVLNTRTLPRLRKLLANRR